MCEVIGVNPQIICLSGSSTQLGGATEDDWGEL